MRAAAVALGILGGAIPLALLLGVFLFLSLGTGSPLPAGLQEGAPLPALLTGPLTLALGLRPLEAVMVAVFLAIVGMVGGVLAVAEPLAGGILMVLMGIGGLSLLPVLWLVGGPLLISGGLLALLTLRPS